MKWPSASLSRLMYPWIAPTGVEIALSNGHPLSILWNTTIYGSFARSHHSAKVSVDPLNSILRLLLELRACSMGVDHLQFPGSYPLVPSLRSIVCDDDGRVPISFAKASYEFIQRSQTVIGGILPPYRFQSLKVGSIQRRIMVFQTSYSGFLKLNRIRPAFKQIRHSTELFLSNLTREFSGVSSCPFLQKFVLRLAGIRLSISYV